MTNENLQHIFFVDNEPTVCKAVCESLELHGINVTGFTSGQDCLKQLDSQRCDLLITDLKMPEMDGIELIVKAKHLVPWLPVLMISGYGDIPATVTAMNAGAIDFIEKPLETKTFLQKIESVLQQNHDKNNLMNNSLTKTEIEILKMIIKGDSSKKIAYLLNRSTRTAEAHRTSIMKKFGAENVADLIRRAALIGLVESPNCHINNDISKKTPVSS